MHRFPEKCETKEAGEMCKATPRGTGKGAKSKNYNEDRNITPRDVRARKRENARKRCTYPPFHETGPYFHGARRGRRESFS